MTATQTVAEIDFLSYEQSVPEAMAAVEAAEVLAGQSLVLVKPNLVTSSPPPVTTPVQCVEAVARYVLEHSEAEVVVAEGAGAAGSETAEIFKALGYASMAERLGVRLLDLNHAELTTSRREDCTLLPEMHLPEILFRSFIISVPMLKAHLFCRFSGTMKNMMGVLPPAHYGSGGGWKKSSFHQRLDAKIADLNRHRAPDLTLMDASVGLPDSHLSGPCCDPPCGKLLAGYDPVETDRRGAELLGLIWRDVGHLRG
jgi:uncharacterized protein (DUF362 family)